ncbi:MAG: AbrB/MazE/SpoVT family DNA-binding domain-containing protein [Rhodoferax sp.]
MQVAKWGNSLAVRLPMALVRELGVKEGDELLVRVISPASQKVVEVTAERAPGKSELLAGVRHLRSPWPEDFAFNRDEANAR